MRFLLCEYPIDNPTVKKEKVVGISLIFMYKYKFYYRTDFGIFPNRVVRNAVATRPAPLITCAMLRPDSVCVNRE